jgi:hypothetical protein
MSTGLISQIRRMLGQYQPLSTYHLPSAPILTVPIPNLSVSVAEKALESLSSPDPLREGMKDVWKKKRMEQPYRKNDRQQSGKNRKRQRKKIYRKTKKEVV